VQFTVVDPDNINLILQMNRISIQQDSTLYCDQLCYNDFMIRDCLYMVINLWNLVYRLTKTQTPPSYFLLAFAVSVIAMSSDEMQLLSNCASDSASGGGE